MLGFDTKNPARTVRSGPSKYFEVTRGLSVHVFKAPTTATSHPAVGKPNPVQTRPTGGPVWSKPPVYPSRPDNERKTLLTRPPPSADYDTAFVVNRSKPRKNYGIYPSATSNMYIYERSVSSASDALTSSHSSSSSDSDDSVSGSVTSAGIEVSSTRASSSTETLETAALSVRAHVPNSMSAAPTSLRVASSLGSRVTTDTTGTSSRGLIATFEDVSAHFGAPPPTFEVPIHLSPVETLSDSDSDTVVDDPVIDMAGPPRAPDAGLRDEGRRDVSLTVPPVNIASLPIRRDPNEHLNNQAPRSRDSPETQRNTPSTPPTAPPATYQYEEQSNLRAPPGLPVTTTYDGGDQLRRVAAGSSTHANNGPDARPPQRPPPTSLPMANRTISTSVSAPAVLTRNGEHNSYNSPSRSIERDTEVRAISTIPLARATSLMGGGVETVSLRRCVRWNENLVCPSPVPPSERRKGWFNRRGDQLWTNDGRYKAPEAGREYPPDLIGYPEPNSGWMNEQGVRIDMEHHLIPKPPLRSAMKRPKVSPIQ